MRHRRLSTRTQAERAAWGLPLIDPNPPGATSGLHRSTLQGDGTPEDRPPAGARQWPQLTLQEARRQGQLELFPGHVSRVPKK